MITECGIDPLVNPRPPETPPGTWRDLGAFWTEHDNEPDNADYYYRQLLWYSGESSPHSSMRSSTQAFVTRRGTTVRPALTFGVSRQLIGNVRQIALRHAS